MKTLTLRIPRSRKPLADLPPSPWSLPSQEILHSLDVSAEKGLKSGEVRKRRNTFGANALREVKPKNTWAILLNQFKNLIVFFLVAAALLSLVFGDYVEAAAIAVVILINALIGFLTELKGARSIEALRKLGTVSSRVRRSGIVKEIPAKALVPGDIVILEGGDIVTADLRLINASKLQADESVLTGESLPVSKAVDPIGESATLADRTNMLFKGTALTRGSGEAVVVNTGMHTELGKISSLVEETEEESTPLEKRLNQLGHWLIWVCLGLALLVAVTGILSGKDFILMIETAIALAVASIPEGLPIVATIALARGVWRMARRNALIKELAAVETLGATSVICTDKTGTLTENRLTATTLLLAGRDIEINARAEEDSEVFLHDGRAYLPSDHPRLTKALQVGVLCNNASMDLGEKKSPGKTIGDPLEIALLAIAARCGLTRQGLEQSMPEMREDAFDSESKMMATFHKAATDDYIVAVKGAPEDVLHDSSAILTEEGEEMLSERAKDFWREKNDALAAAGLRVLGLATKTVADLNALPYENLVFIGLIGLTDPPREDVKQSVQLCRSAGIRIIMATGDQPVTARAIGSAVGLVDDANAPVIHGRDLKSPENLSESEKHTLLQTNLFARVSPKQKLDLISIHRENGAIVAMTGDGVNDAPALKKADIGIAMGKRGTQVAREAADMILKDDSFSSIIHAVEQGRIIFKNIRNFVIYLLSCNISEIMTVTLASLVNAPLPILPLQILFLNIVTDVFPALALAAGESSAAIMTQPPRNRNEPIMSTRHWFGVAGYGFAITVSVLGALALALLWLDMNEKQAVTISFLTLAFAQLWHVFNMRDRTTGLLNNAIVKNPFIWGAIMLCSGLLVAIIHVPVLARVLKVVDPGLHGWALILGMSLLPLIVGQLFLVFAGRKTN